PLVVERERDRCGHALDELALLEQPVLVHERADPASLVLDRRRGASRAARRELEPVALAVDEAAAVLDAVGDLERRVAERVGDCVAELLPLADREHEAGDGTAGEPAAEDAEQERERNGGEEDEE